MGWSHVIAFIVGLVSCSLVHMGIIGRCGKEKVVHVLPCASSNAHPPILLTNHLAGPLPKHTHPSRAFGFWLLLQGK